MSSFIYDSQNGRLSLWQQWRITMAVIASRLVSASRRDGKAAKFDARNLTPDDVATLSIPKDALSRHALGLAQATQPAWLVQHAMRSYIWAELLGMQAELKPAQPLLFAACMLHDVGLTAHAATPEQHCFAVRGARYAQQHLAPLATPQQSLVIAQAISLHLDLQVDLSRGVEAHLLQAGAGLDVLGRGIKQLPDDVRSAVLLRHPRMDMNPQLSECMRTVGMQAPATRMGLYVKRFGFIGLIQNAPFQDAENPSTAHSERKL